MQSSFTFELDGETIRATGEPVFRTLAHFLDGEGYGKERRFHRSDPWMGGSPLLLLDADTRSQTVLRSVDAGSILLPAVAGRQLWSAEGLVRSAERGEAHPAIELLGALPDLATSWQARARVITALVEAWHRPDLQHPAQLTDHFDGCLSRVVSYPALRDLATSILANTQKAGLDDPFSALLAQEWPEREEFSYVDREKRRFYRPHTIVDLARLLAQFPKATLVGGSTGLAWSGPEATVDWSCLISIDGVSDLRTVFDQTDKWAIGAAASLTSVTEALGDPCPALAKAARRHATRAIRNRATLGGGLASARADDPLAPALMAMDATVRAVSVDGEREIPVARFFEGNGRTNLRPGEFVADVIVPKFTAAVLKTRGAALRMCDTYQAASRRTLTPDGLSAGFAVELDGNSRITQAFLAYAGVADRPVRAREAEKALVGKSWSEETVIGILGRLNQEIDTALSPAAQASRTALLEREREYRRQLVITLLQKFFYQYPQPSTAPANLGVIGDYLAPKAARI